MKIALLGYGKEGKSAEKYFKNKYDDVKFDNVVVNGEPLVVKK